MNFLIGAAFQRGRTVDSDLMFSGIRLTGAGDALLANLGPGGEAAVYFLLAGAVLGAVNMVVRPIVNVLSLPFCLTLGLFFVVVNALMLVLTAWITSHFAMSSSSTASVGRSRAASSSAWSTGPEPDHRPRLAFRWHCARVPRLREPKLAFVSTFRRSSVR